jgi:hypothetical protein
LDQAKKAQKAAAAHRRALTEENKRRKVFLEEQKAQNIHATAIPFSEDKDLRRKEYAEKVGDISLDEFSVAL